jgi:hypothetical protein
VPPADATLVDDWHPEDGIENPAPARYLDGVFWPMLHISGVQNPDGTVRERWITVDTDTDTDDLDVATARALGRYLLAAADHRPQQSCAGVGRTSAWNSTIHHRPQRRGGLRDGDAHRRNNRVRFESRPQALRVAAGLSVSSLGGHTSF